MKAIGEKVYIRLLNTDDISDSYVKWMNDPEVTQFTESRLQSHTHKSTFEFVDATNRSANNYLFGIFLIENDLHIGNVKIGSINFIHRHADVGMIVGKKDNWTKGVGSDAFLLIEKIARDELNLKKLIGGIYADNIGSFKMTQKCGWREVGRYEKHVFYKGEYMDVILVEKVFN
jgi:[ribosomal protein S5]-alanine N-acetyltransferase